MKQWRKSKAISYDEETFTAEHFVRRVASTEGMSGTQLLAGEVFVACAFSTTLSVTVAYATASTATLNPELPLTAMQKEEVDEYVKTRSDGLLDDGYTDLKGKWELKGWDSYYNNDNRTFRVRYTETVEFDRDVFILADAGFRVAAYFEAGGYASATTIIKLPKGTRAHIYIRRAQEDASEVADVAEFAAACHISSCIADIERFRYTFSDVSMFVRMGICGDSYANGGGIISGIRPLTWGKNIERQTGVTVDIYARSGQTVVQWVDDSVRGLPALLAGPECGLYWMQHGINGTSTPEQLGTPADMSADPKPATFYGKYTEAVQSIQEQFPNSRIVLATIIGSTSGLYDTQYLAVNEAIKTIAQFCAVPCVDVVNDDFYKSSWYKEGMRSNHPTAMIAAGMAIANCRLISRCIQDNPDYFVNYGSTGYSITGKGLSTNDYTDEDKAKIDAIGRSERYSVGEEMLIGEWVDGEGTHDLYRKVIDFGALTNATQKTVPHGIASPFVVTKITGVASVSDRSNILPLPFAANDPAKSIYLAVGRNNVTITPSSDRSNYTATVVIEYYKPTA